MTAGATITAHCIAQQSLLKLRFIFCSIVQTTFITAGNRCDMKEFSCSCFYFARCVFYDSLLLPLAPIRSLQCSHNFIEAKISTSLVSTKQQQLTTRLETTLQCRLTNLNSPSANTLPPSTVPTISLLLNSNLSLTTSITRISTIAPRMISFVEVMA